MKILHELNQLEMGGVERVVAGIIKHDRLNSHSVYSYKDGPMKEILQKAGAEVHIEGEDTIETDAEIIHIHTGGDPSLVASCTKGQILTVETVHSPVVSAVRDEWIHARVGVSNQVTKLNRKCRTIYNGVDTQRLDTALMVAVEGSIATSISGTFRTAHGIPQDAFVVGRLGRLGFDKCLEEWMVACWKFQKSNLCPNPHFVIVGDEASNARGYLSKLKIAAASFPLKNVHFIPALEAIGWALEAMDIFMYPSPTEGFGLAYMEAMACGIPALLWENSLTKEIALGAAWLAKPTVKDLAESLIYLFINKEIREQFAEEGQKHVLNEFTEEIMSANYQRLYAEVAGVPASASV